MRRIQRSAYTPTGGPVAIVLVIALLAAGCASGPSEPTAVAPGSAAPSLAGATPGQSVPAASGPQGTAAPGGPTAQPATTPAPGPVTPVTGHPRLWFTERDLPGLRARTTDANVVWSQGLKAVAEGMRARMDDGTIPKADSGGREYEEYASENVAAIFALMSLVDPDESARADWGRRARDILVHAIQEAAKGPAEGQPFRDPIFATADSNRARWYGEGWALAVDWAYPFFSADDKRMIRDVFLRWSEEIVQQAYHRPEPVGALNDPALVADPVEARWAGNNHATALMRNLGLMAMSFDAADDPDGKLAAYLRPATGAFLYRLDHLLRTDARGGLAAEGFEYSPQQLGYAAQFLLALHTAGRDDPAILGPQVVLAGNPFWSDVLPALLNTMSPVPITIEDVGPVYLADWYGDGQHYRFPDFIELLAPLGLYDASTGNADRLAAIRWIETNAAPGGGERLAARATGDTGYPRDAILYFLLFDPSASPPADPRPATPTSWLSEGLGRLYARTGWDADARWFAFASGWITIDHQEGDANRIDFYRKGEFLTTEVTGYDMLSSDFHNTLGLENDPLPVDHQDGLRLELWRRGSQYLGGQAGDARLVAHSTGDGFVYAMGDATDAYNSPNEEADDVVTATRAVAWLEPDHIVVFDRAETRTSGRFKRFWLGVPAEPRLSGNIATVTTPGNQQLVVTSLLPDGATLEATDVAPPDGGFLAEGNQMIARLRIEAPGNPTSTRFLTVLQGVDGGRQADAVRIVRSDEGPAFVGAAIEARHAVVLFPDAGAPPNAPFSYSVGARLAPGQDGTVHLVTGLAPGAGYAVSVEGSGEAVRVRVSPGGSLIADAGGVLVIAIAP